MLDRFQLYTVFSAASIRMMPIIPEIKRNKDGIVDWRLRCGEDASVVVVVVVVDDFVVFVLFRFVAYLKNYQILPHIWKKYGISFTVNSSLLANQ